MERFDMPQPYHYARMRASGRKIFCLLTFLSVVFTFLLLLQVDVYSTCSGLVRPERERTELKRREPVRISSIHLRDGDYAEAGTLIMEFADDARMRKRELSEKALQLSRTAVADLKLLAAAITAGDTPEQWMHLLQQDRFRAEAVQYLAEKQRLDAGVERIGAQTSAGRVLAALGHISASEWQELLTEERRLRAQSAELTAGRVAGWLAVLEVSEGECRQIEAGLYSPDMDHSMYELRAPVAGFIQSINHHYPGSTVLAGETIAVLSPTQALIAECHVPAADIGAVYEGQRVRFRMAAYDYREWGVWEGSVIYVEDDLMQIPSGHYFRVRCSLDTNRKGSAHRPVLKKGMGFQADFFQARRSIWQLLFRRIDDVLNPLPEKKYL